jgi:hypothetical protein
VEGVAAVGEHAHHILRLVLLQAHRAAACGRAPSLGHHLDIVAEYTTCVHMVIGKSKGCTC